MAVRSIWVLLKLSQMATSPLPLSLVTMGSSAPSGSLGLAREMASRTSEVPSSMFQPSLNSTVMEERPLRVTELMFLMPLMPES